MAWPTPSRPPSRTPTAASRGWCSSSATGLVPKDIPSDTVLIFVDPVGGGGYLPMVTELARARQPRDLRQQPLPGQRLGTDHGEGRAVTSAAAIRPRARERLGYPADRARRLERRRPRCRSSTSSRPSKPSVPAAPRQVTPRASSSRRADPRRGDPAAGRTSEPAPRARATASTLPSSTSPDPERP